jgi:uncharacterized protein YecE (DUF72 family)
VRILAGTSGWSFTAWRGPFYEAGLPADRMLAAYAARLPTVEVNATFYRMPRRSVLASWLEEVPTGFRFAVKTPQRITHALKLAGVEEPLGYFLRALTALGGALGPVLVQLPPWLRKDLPRLQAFLALLPPGLRAAFEFRHGSWRDDEVHAALAAAGAALCVSDAEEAPTPLVATAPFGYLRLRRRDYDAAAVGAWTERIRAMPWSEAYVYFKHEQEALGAAWAALMGRLAAGEPAALTGR